MTVKHNSCEEKIQPIEDFIQELESKKIKMRLNGDSLSCKTPKGYAYPEVIADLKLRKNEIIKYLKVQKEKDLYFQSINKADEKEFYHVSAAQKRLFVIDRMGGNNTNYNLSGALIIEGNLNISRMEEVFKALIERHEALRTSFHMINDEPYQKVHEDVHFSLEYLDACEAEVSDVIKGFVRPFDLSKAPLLRVGLISVSSQKRFMVFDMHHIISDGVSTSILTREFVSLYSGESLKEAMLKYKDYSEWQCKLCNSDFMKEKERYWLNTFYGDIPKLNMPLDLKRPSIRSFEGETIKFGVDKDLTEKLKEMGSSSGSTLYMVLLAAYTTLLHKYTGQDDIIVGSVAAGRLNPDLQNIIGMFVNTLAIRNFPSDSKVFIEYLNEVKSYSINAFQNQDYQFEDLVNRLGVGNDLSRNPLFDTMFVLQNMEMESIDISGLNFKSYEIENNNSKFDITLEAVEKNGILNFKLEYCAALFRKEKMQMFAIHFTNILKEITDNPHIKISDIDILTKEEKKTILNEFNKTDAMYPADLTIHQLFENQAEKNPDNIAVVFEKKQLTYKELNEKANQLARLLCKKGVKSDSIVAIMFDRSIEMIVGILAVLKAGGAYLPIDPEYPPDRIGFMLNDSETNILLTHEKYAFDIRFDGEIIKVDEAVYNGEVSNLENKNSSNDLAYIIYTSGTTGKPKGVMIEHRNVVRLLFNDKFQFDFKETDIWTMFHSYCFDFSVWEMYGALLYGGKLVVVPKMTARDPKQYLSLLKEHKVTVLNQTPTAFYNLALEETYNEEKELKIRYVIFGGEALSPAMLKEWRNKYKDSRFINMYGITETTVHVTYKEITDKEIESNISNIGKPIPTLTTYIMDAHMQLVPVGAAGELCVGGAGVGRGYLNRPELTSLKFAQNPYKPGERIYRSGDLARYLPDGEMEYLGRIDQQVKIRGHRIELGEIESLLLKHEAIKEAVVIPRDEEGIPYLCAYMVTEKELLTDEIRGYLGKGLPKYMIPSYFINLQSIPLTPNGKLDRKALPKPDSKIFALKQYEEPRNPLEKEMVRIWEEVLGLQGIGINQSFFTLGGDSIKAIKLVSRMNDSLGSNMNIEDIYLNQQIKELSFFVVKDGGYDIKADLKNGLNMIENIRESVLNDSKQASNLSEDVEDFYPLSRIQHGMVFYSRLRPEEPIYHDQFTYLVKFEKFDVAVFNKAINMLIKKHQILRTTFEVDKFDQPLQLIHKEMIQSIVMEDISHLTLGKQEQKIERFMQEDLKKKFGFNGDLLWRMRVFKLNSYNYCILLSFQHAILDGWSVASLAAELLQVYNKLINGETVKEHVLKSSYKDYVAINLSRRSNEKTQEYWKNLLSGYTRTKLPFNISSKRINNTTGSITYRKGLSRDLLSSLEKQAKKYGCALKEICLSAYVYLLGVITTEEDIVTGVVTHDRPVIADSEKVLGCFLNTIPIRMNTQKKIDKLELLTRVKDYIVNVKPHELFLAEIANIIGEVNNSGNPIFDTLFNFIDFHVVEDTVKTDDKVQSDYEINIKQSEMTNTLFDLEVSKTLNNFYIQIKYSPNYFCNEDIETAAKLYERILEKYACEERFIGVEELITDNEKDKILYEFNNTLISYPKHRTMHSLFEEQAQRVPNNNALVCEGKTITYKELNEKSNRFSRLLIDRGVVPGDHVALIARRGFDMIIGMLGILKAGGAYVPIDPEYPCARIEYIISNAKVSAVVVDRHYDISFKNVVEIDYFQMEHYSIDSANIETDPKQLAYVIYTSGSTGNPKGVTIEHHSAVNLITWVNREFNVCDNDRLLFITSMCFDLSVYDIFGILAAGGSVVIAKKEQIQNPIDLKNILINEKITFWDSVPTTMNYLVNSMEDEGKEYAQYDLRLVFMSGDWIPVRLPERLKKYFPKTRVISLGGATEGTVWSIYYPVETVNEFQSSIPYGRPIDNNYFYILDNDRNILPCGVAGELYIGGVGVAAGYMNDEERTRVSFFKNKFLQAEDEMMYKTGDLGRMLPDGNIEFLGRIDHQVKIRGFRVELGEVESSLLRHDNVKEAVVIDKTADGNKYLCAYLVSDIELSASKLRQHLQKELPDYMIPSYFVRLDSIPLTSNGKIDRKALPDPEISLNHDEEYSAPINEVEEKLVAIWQEVLEIDKVGTKNNFFEIGGDSFAAIKIATEAKQHKIKINVADIFKFMTISRIAENAEVIIDKDDGAASIENRLAEDNDKDRYIETHGTLIPGIHTDKIRKLPINMQSNVTSYLHYSYPLCIILTDEKRYPWFYQHFIQIFSTTHTYGPLRLEYLERMNFYAEIFDVHKDLGCKELVDIPDMIEFIKKKIDDGCYVIVNVDEYYLPQKSFYMKEHFIHQQLVYGYDDEKKKIMTAGFNNERIFTEIFYDFETFNEAYELGKLYYKPYATWVEDRAVQILRPNNNTHNFSFQLPIFKNQLNDYITSSDNNAEIVYDYETSENLTNCDPVRFGVNVHNAVIQHIEKTFTGELTINFIQFHLLYEHKKGLYDRLRYIEQEYIVDPKLGMLIDRYLKVVELANAIRLKALNLEYAFTGEGKDDDIMHKETTGIIGSAMRDFIEKIKLIKEQEREILGQVIDVL
ncbi:MAG: amino acid adenylation domain-containing protein [Bacillota bacterium]|nr:amino acid adenylation domain-containing protein [Bacillota bacterium]